MRRRNLAKMAGALGIAAIALAFSGIVNPVLTLGVPGVVCAATNTKTFTYNDVTYTYSVVEGNQIELTKYGGSASTVDLPAILKGAKEIEENNLSEDVEIVSIGKQAFYSKSRLTTIVLPNSLETIGKEAFWNCGILSTVQWEDAEAVKKLSTIGDGAFRNCTKLTKIDLPEGLTSIGGLAFNKTGLTEVTIPATCTSIGGSSTSSISGAFEACSSLKTVTFAERGDANIDIQGYAFYESGLTSIELPENVSVNAGGSTISPHLFAKCTSLTEVTLPDNCNVIDKYAFSQTEISEINIPNGCVTISEGAFNSTKLQTVTIPASVKTIGSYAFNTATLKKVDFVIGGNPTLENTKPFYEYGGYLFLCEPNTEAESYAKNTETRDGIRYQRHTKQLKVSVNPTKTEYDYGEEFDWSGIQLQAVYTADPINEDETEKWVDISDFIDAEGNVNANYDYTVYDKNVATKQTIKISYGGAETEEGIDVYCYYNMEKDVGVSYRFDSLEFTGGDIEAKEVTVTNLHTDKAVPEGSYEVSYENNKFAGDAVLKVEGKKNAESAVLYRGSQEIAFTITPADLETADIQVAWDQDAYIYNSLEQKPVVALTYNDYELNNETDGYTDYELTYSDNRINATTEAYVIVTAPEEGSNFTGSKTIPFTIKPMELAEDMIELVDITEGFAYTGGEITPAVNKVSFTPEGSEEPVELVEGEDYTVSYDKNIDVGEEAEVIVSAIEGSNFTGSVTKSFTINSVELNDEDFDITIADLEYTGEKVTPTVKDLTIKKGDVKLRTTDYEVTLDENEAYVEPGEYEITITGKNNLTGSVTVFYNIVPASLKNAKIEIENADQLYATGEAVEPKVTVKLNDKVVPADSYEVSYTNNKNKGEATVTVTAKKDAAGKGNYDDSVTGKYTIQCLSIDEAGSGVDTITFAITLDADKIVYDGTEVSPEVKVKKLTKKADGTKEILLEEDTDYTVEVGKKAVEVGVYTVTVKGTGNYTGTRTLSFQITAKNLSSAKLSAIAEQKWTGKEITPDVDVTLDGKALVEDVDFEVTYSDNVNEGTAKVTVTGIGNYTGSAEGTFTIKKPIEPTTTQEPTTTEAPKTEATTEAPKTEVTTEAPATTEAPKTEVTTEAITEDTEEVEAPAKTKIKNLLNRAPKKVIVSWKKLSGVSGYEVSIATKKNFKTGKKVKTTKKTSYTFTKLKKGTTYYVRVRAYNVDGSTKVYGKYSAVKKIKVK